MAWYWGWSITGKRTKEGRGSEGSKSKKEKALINDQEFISIFGDRIDLGGAARNLRGLDRSTLRGGPLRASRRVFMCIELWIGLYLAD